MRQVVVPRHVVEAVLLDAEVAAAHGYPSDAVLDTPRPEVRVEHLAAEGRDREVFASRIYRSAGAVLALNGWTDRQMNGQMDGYVRWSTSCFDAVSNEYIMGTEHMRRHCYWPCIVRIEPFFREREKGEREGESDSTAS